MCYLGKVLFPGWRRFPLRSLGCTSKHNATRNTNALKESDLNLKSTAQLCQSTHFHLSKCVTHLNLTLFSIPLASSWVTPIRDSLLMAMSWSPGLKRPSWRKRRGAADVITSEATKLLQRSVEQQCSLNSPVSCWHAGYLGLWFASQKSKIQV